MTKSSLMKMFVGEIFDARNVTFKTKATANECKTCYTVREFDKGQGEYYITWFTHTSLHELLVLVKY